MNVRYLVLLLVPTVLYAQTQITGPTILQGGPPGPQGTPGTPGTPGVGVPLNGTPGQVTTIGGTGSVPTLIGNTVLPMANTQKLPALLNDLCVTPLNGYGMVYNGVNWACGPILAVAAGTSGQVQYNSGGAFGAVSGFTFNSGTNTLAVSGTVAAGTTNPVTIGGASGSCTGLYAKADGTGCDTPSAVTGGVWQHLGTVISPSYTTDGAWVQEPILGHDTSPEVITTGLQTGAVVFHAWFDCGSTVNPYYQGVCYAESLDGTTWTRANSGAPIIGGTITYNVGRSWIYYSTLDSQWEWFGSDITSHWYYAHSAFKSHGWTTPALMNVSSAHWTAGNTMGGNISVWEEGSTRYMSLEGEGSSGQPNNGTWAIGFLTATTDPTNWTALNSGNPVLLHPAGSSTGNLGGAEVHVNPNYPANGLPKYWMWVHGGTTNTNLPSDIYFWQSNGPVGTAANWTSPLSGTALSRILTSEGVGLAAAQVADPSLDELNGKTFMLHDAIVSQSGSSINLSVANMTLAQIVQSIQGNAPPGSASSSSSTSGTSVAVTTSTKSPATQATLQDYSVNGTVDQGFFGTNYYWTGSALARQNTAMSGCRFFMNSTTTNAATASGLTCLTTAGVDKSMIIASMDSSGNPTVTIPNLAVTTCTGCGSLPTGMNWDSTLKELYFGASTKATPTYISSQHYSPNANVDQSIVGANYYYNGSALTRQNTGMTGARVWMNAATSNVFANFGVTFADISGTDRTVMTAGMDASGNTYLQAREVCSTAFPNVCDVWGSGAPTGSNCSASPNGTTTFGLGSVYHNILGGAATSLYVCEVAGAWAAK
jgi:hypothetical protein